MTPCAGRWLDFTRFAAYPNGQLRLAGNYCAANQPRDLMLCERCRMADVTVYVTEVFWPGLEPEKHEFCDACYAVAEAERSERFLARFNTRTIPELDPGQMTALEYLDACERAARNGPDKLELKRLMSELAKQPAAQQRLVFEILPIIWQRLELTGNSGLSITMLFIFAGNLWGLIEPQRSEEYASWAEKIVFRCYERSDNGDYGSQIGVFVMFAALHKVDPKRSAVVLEILKGQGLERGPDPRWQILARAEKLIAAKKSPAG